MSNKLEDQLATILQAIHAAANKAGDFALSQLPDIAQQAIIYGRITTLIAVVLGILLVALAFVGLALAIKETRKGCVEEDGGTLFGGLIGGSIAGFVGGMLLLLNTSNAIMVWFAPKLWLLKELASLIK